MARGSSLYRSVVKVLEYVPTFLKLSEKKESCEFVLDPEKRADSHMHASLHYVKTVFISFYSIWGSNRARMWLFHTERAHLTIQDLNSAYRVCCAIFNSTGST